MYCSYDQDGLSVVQIGIWTGRRRLLSGNPLTMEALTARHGNPDIGQI